MFNLRSGTEQTHHLIFGSLEDDSIPGPVRVIMRNGRLLNPPIVLTMEDIWRDHGNKSRKPEISKRPRLLLKQRAIMAHQMRRLNRARFMPMDSQTHPLRPLTDSL